MGGGASRLKRAAAKRIVVAACGCTKPQLDPTTSQISGSSPQDLSELTVTTTAHKVTSANNKNICAICLDPLNYINVQAIFTAHCSHAFHLGCISSNVRHGSVTCPICRAHWTQLPRPPCSASSCNQNDPILDDSIATFRVHRRSFLRYDDDDPVEPGQTPNHPRINLSLLPIPPPIPPTLHHLMTSTSLFQQPNGQVSYTCASNRAYLSVKLAHHPATDLVLVASPNGPHLRLLKQSMAVVVFSLRPIDHLAIVTHSSAAAALIFPLRRMTSYGKTSALQVIDRIFYMGQADAMEGLKKGIKILEDRAHKNPESCILHLSDSPTRSYHREVRVPIHQFHVGFSFGTSNGFVMREFEELLGRLLGGMVGEVQLRIGEGGMVRLGELRGGEEKRVIVELGENEHVCIGYSYVEGGVHYNGRSCAEFGRKESEEDGTGSRSCDPYMARRWAKHLHGYRLF